MRFPAKKNAGCPKAPCNFPPRKDGIFQPPLGYLGTPLSLPQSLYGRAGVRWCHNQNFSDLYRLPNLFSIEAPLWPAGSAKQKK